MMYHIYPIAFFFFFLNYGAFHKYPVPVNFICANNKCGCRKMQTSLFFDLVENKKLEGRIRIFIRNKNKVLTGNNNKTVNRVIYEKGK